MSAQALLAVIEVPFDERVRCCAPGCGHSVYKRVHIVRNGNSIEIFGSDCFSRLFKGSAAFRSKPKYSDTLGRVLTMEERELLRENTERLIETFERQRQKVEPLIAPQPAPALAPVSTGPTAPPLEARKVSHPAQPRLTRPEAEEIARRRLRESMPDIDLNLPGNKGFIWLETEKVLRESAA